MTTIAIKVQEKGVLEVAADSQLTQSNIRRMISKYDRVSNDSGKIHKQIYDIPVDEDKVKHFPIIFGHTGEISDNYLIRDLFEPHCPLAEAIIEAVRDNSCPIRSICSQKLQDVGISDRVFDDSSFFIAYWSELQGEFIIGIGTIKHSRLILRPITLLPGDFYAVGSGREFALGAMQCGATAATAVEVAKIYDIYTDGNVYVEKIEC